ncbi:MAG: cytochrome c-type biogenesis protein [Chloroflexota bacterium]
MNLRITNYVLRITFYALVLSTLGVATVSAQASTPTDDEVNAIAKQLYCPVCENTPLDVCPTQACREWREEIRKLLAEGKSEAEIKQHFVDYYGARVLAEPPRSGFNWLVYVVPPIAIVAGVFVLFRALRGWSQASVAGAPLEGGAGAGEAEAALPSQDEYVARLEEELKKRK